MDHTSSPAKDQCESSSAKGHASSTAAKEKSSEKVMDELDYRISPLNLPHLSLYTVANGYSLYFFFLSMYFTKKVFIIILTEKGRRAFTFHCKIMSPSTERLYTCGRYSLVCLSVNLINQF